MNLEQMVEALTSPPLSPVIRKENKMTPLHEAAQSVGWFAITVVVGIAVILFIDFKKEKKDD